MTITSSLIHKQLMLAIAQQQLIVSPEISVMAAIELMGEMGASCAIVSGSEGRELLGIFTERDLVRLCIQSVPLAQLTMQAVMSHPVITIQETSLNNINDVMTLFQTHQIRHLPILNGDRFMGVLTKDVLTEILAQVVLNSSDGEQKTIPEGDSRFMNIAAAAPVAIFRFDKIFNCIYVNDRWSEITGRSPESALGNGWMEALHPDDLDRLISQWTQDSNQANLNSPAVINSEGRLLRLDGSINWFYVQIVPEIDQENQITGYIGTLMDITARKQAKLEMQKNEQRDRALIDGASDEILLANPQGNLIDGNQKAEELLGYGSNELKSLHILNHDGSINWFYVQVVPEIDDENQITSYIGALMDITARKQAELDLQKYEHRYRVLMDAASDAILLANPQGNLIEANLKAEELLGYSRDELKSLNMSQIHPPDALQAARNHFKNVQKNNFAPAMESLVLTKDGSQVPVEITGSRIDIDGVSIAQGIFRDISDRKRYEQQLEQTNAELIRATRLKDEFLATMSHELRTPLNAILGMTEALQEEVFGILNEPQITALQLVERSSYHLLELINDILDLAKIEAGQVELSYGSTAIAQLCQSSMIFINQQAHKKQIQFEIQIAPNLPDISLDERRIRQVLINLLNNAVKFTPKGGQIRLEVDRREEQSSPNDRAWLRFSITDTGIGIAPENIQKLFQPFIQIDSALNRKYDGTGLGLALVKQIVDLHGGRVSLTSELGVGSCFVVDIPYINTVLTPSESATQINPNLETDKPEQTRSPLILIAEDNQTNIDTISDYLVAKGYRLLIARDGAEAIALTKSHHPDIILMDIQMPVMDGLEAIKQIRLDPNLSDIPIIALTALAMTGDRDRCLEAGANEYLSKPVKLKEPAI